MAEDAKVSDALWKAIVSWSGGSTEHDCGQIFRQIWSGETYYKSIRLYGSLFLYMKPLQVTGRCTPNLLLSPVCWLVSWQIQPGKACARSLQMFVSSCWFIFRMYYLPMTVVWSMASWGRENVQHREIILFFIHSLAFLFPSFSIIFTRNTEQVEVFSMQWVPLLMFHSYPSTISLNFLGVSLFFSLGHRRIHCSFMHCSLQLYPAGMLYSWFSI